MPSIPMLRNTLAVALLITGISVKAAAQQRDSLPRVVTTATRVDAAAGSTVAATSIIDRAQIDRMGVRDVAELLRLVPGVSIARSGGPGAQSSIFLRGGENDYVRVLIDGVPVNDPGGAVDLAWLSVDDIDRIEVVRGPSSVLYGTDAVTGVVQLFTRRLPANAIEGAVSAGRYGSTLMRASAALGSPAVNLTVGAASERSDGILPFNSDYLRDGVNAALRVRPGSGPSLDLTMRGLRDEYHFPTDGAGSVEDRNAYRDSRRLIGAATLTHAFSSRVRGELAFTGSAIRGRDDDRPDTAADTMGFYYYDARQTVRRKTADSRLHVMLSPSSILTLGVEAVGEAQRGNDSSNYSFERSRFVEDRSNHAVYAQWLAERGRLSLTAGARYDDNDTFGAFQTARAGMSVRTWPGGSVRATIGTAFKAPTFFESFNTAFSTGNPDLEPERSRSWEAGVRHLTSSGRISVSATWFDQRFRDMIQYAFVSISDPNYFNVARASASGLELEASVAASPRVHLGASTTFLKTRVDDAGLQTGESATFVEGNRLLRRAPVIAGATVAVNLPGRATTDLAVTYTGRRDDRDFATFPATPVELPSWTRLDLAFTKPLSVGAVDFALIARLENAFDAAYQEIVNYPAPGRSLTIGLRAASLRR